MKIDKIIVFKFEGALRGMRNPKNSWGRSDSSFAVTSLWDNSCLDEAAEAWLQYNHPEIDDSSILNPENDILFENIINWLLQNGTIQSYKEDIYEIAYIGPKDMKLAQQLVAAGPEHRKFLRQIFVSMDITAPLYWWKEFDTYKVGTVADSTSTMHKLTSKPITMDCFDLDDYKEDLYVPRLNQTNASKDYELHWHINEMAEYFVYQLEELRQAVLAETDPVVKQELWKELVRWLPNGWLQTRTWTGNYEILRSMYRQRHNHKLTEWHTFCDTIAKLPYANELILYENT